MHRLRTLWLVTGGSAIGSFVVVVLMASQADSISILAADAIAFLVFIGFAVTASAAWSAGLWLARRRRLRRASWSPQPAGAATDRVGGLCFTVVVIDTFADEPLVLFADGPGRQTIRDAVERAQRVWLLDDPRSRANAPLFAAESGRPIFTRNLVLMPALTQRRRQRAMTAELPRPGTQVRPPRPPSAQPRSRARMRDR